MTTQEVLENEALARRALDRLAGEQAALEASQRAAEQAALDDRRAQYARDLRSAELSTVRQLALVAPIYARRLAAVGRLAEALGTFLAAEYDLTRAEQAALEGVASYYARLDSARERTARLRSEAGLPPDHAALESPRLLTDTREGRLARVVAYGLVMGNLREEGIVIGDSFLRVP